MTVLTISIAGVDKSSMFQANSFSFTDELKNKTTARFDLVDAAGTYRPIRGQLVVIAKSGTTVYSGIIDEFDEEKWTSIANKFSISCVNLSDIFERTIVFGSYDSYAAGDIIKDLVSIFFAAEGITTTNVEDGPVLPLIEFNYIAMSDALNDLAAYSGLSWYIDFNKDIHFYSRTAEPAPWELTDTSADFRNFKITRHREGYRNVQYITNAQGTTGARTETLTGDGSRKSFTVGYPIAFAPLVNQNGTDRSVGVKGVDTGMEWYWSQGSDTLVMDDSETTPIEGEPIVVAYEGLIDIITKVENGDEVDARRTIEGGLGKYEAVESDEGMIGKDLTVQRAASLLRLNGKLPDKIAYETDVDGLRAGMAQSIVVSRHDVSGVFLISKIVAEDVDSKFLRYKVTAINGEATGGWEGFFRSSIGSRKDLPSIVTNGSGTSDVYVVNTAWAKDALTVSDSLIFQASVDTMIAEGVVTNFSAYPWSDIGLLAGQKRRFLTKFDLSSLSPGQPIASAKLRLYCGVMSYGTPPVTTRLRRITSSWGSTVTYATQPSYDATVISSATVDADPFLDWLEFDVTALVSMQLEDPTSCYGYILMSSDETAGKTAQIRTAEDTEGHKAELVIIF
jgi:hypothetical protein